MAAHKRKGSITLRFLIKRLQKHLHPSTRLYVSDCVPNDIKAGHFAVIAKNDVEKPIRFVVELCVLKHPDFLKLLKLAEEDYGFQHTGALQLPCRPDELQRILLDKIY